MIDKPVWHKFLLSEKETWHADMVFTERFTYRLVVNEISEFIFEWKVKLGERISRSGYAKTLERAKMLAEFYVVDVHWYNQVGTPYWDRASAVNGFIYVIWTDFGYKFALREQDKWWISDDWQIEYNLKVYSFIMLPSDPNGK